MDRHSVVHNVVMTYVRTCMTGKNGEAPGSQQAAFLQRVRKIAEQEKANKLRWSVLL